MNFDRMYSAIEAERARKGWTIEECAEHLGISGKTYRNRLAKSQDITASALVQYADAFGVSADYLLGLSDKINRQ